MDQVKSPVSYSVIVATLAGPGIDKALAKIKQRKRWDFLWWDCFSQKLLFIVIFGYLSESYYLFLGALNWRISHFMLYSVQNFLLNNFCTLLFLH